MTEQSNSNVVCLNGGSCKGKQWLTSHFFGLNSGLVWPLFSLITGASRLALRKDNYQVLLAVCQLRVSPAAAIDTAASRPAVSALHQQGGLSIRLDMCSSRSWKSHFVHLLSGLMHNSKIMVMFATDDKTQHAGWALWVKSFKRVELFVAMHCNVVWICVKQFQGLCFPKCVGKQIERKKDNSVAQS